MRITRLVKRLGRVIATKNFGSIRLEAEVQADLVGKEMHNEQARNLADERLFEICSEMLAKDLKRIKEKRKTDGAT